VTASGRYAFPCPPELHERVCAALAEVRAAPAEAGPNKALRAALLELTHFGLDYYFIRPLELAEVTSGKLKTVKVSIGLLRSSIGGFMNSILKPMSGAQMLALCDFVEGLMVG
jgi:hypothetical protein